ncbi:dynamin-2 [Ochromonadaceae sp. CCMP2298]|nr:dynamin-2 [Ochromonadaceae sp. CCMP2298]|mmetsp:Transcript_7349/g.16043  ORF Transcript_7349/g.16043 Transcript_7349/m.16043 type:complete len:745 (+) Transcript_7349:200-2434(+)|eukprot:CAMPEP_0173234022 /NCGR_PEP_ID=MMETSP1142-20121109/9966_1 /TAXON_ID=483371 /ORGANISM="non described non described, Strain CCMP2298" /LENGTH=744 /DNA_ID=CAMNT_0014163959 /DNA_START=128 /DNA_END=2362 /DNA_ORIENTATION=+
MEQLIPVVNKLQDVFSAIGQQTLDLPQICVVGSQSAGKSSVLENIVGRDFLPRGTGICTRRPLVLQLYCTAAAEEADVDVDELAAEENCNGSAKEWGEFLHLPGQRFHDFSEIRSEIERETDRVSGRNKGISNKSINLKIFSPYVLNLTLVDLPGITKVPTGDQPEDVEQQILSMCREFISNPNAIILAVSAANQDLVNSEGLKLARSVDPEGLRTIGVLTKVDIMDHGTDCCDVLNNQVIPLRRGYIAVINRSQKDIIDALPIRKALLKEQKYFQSHPKYRSQLAKCGTGNMARTLNQLLMNHIRDCLPEIKARINKLLYDVTLNVASLGESLEESGSAKGITLLKILAQFATNFSNKVDGKGQGSTEAMAEMTELYGGARISYIFNEIFGRRLRTLDPFEGLADEDIRTAIANANGTRPSLFVPEISFDLLVRKQIVRLEQPGLDCLDKVHDEMLRMVGQSQTLELSRFPDLRDRAMEVVNVLLRNCMRPAGQMISDLIQIELAYINTSHPDFVGGKAAVAAAQQSRKLHAPGAGPGAAGPGPVGVRPPSANQGNQGMSNGNGNGLNGNGGNEHDMPGGHPGQGEGQGFFGFFQSPSGKGAGAGTGHAYPPRNSMDFSTPGDLSVIKLPQVPERMRCAANPTDKERVETEIIKTLISSYFDIVKKNFMDLVPKAVMRFLVLSFKESLQNELVAQLYREEVMSELMRETEDVAGKRRAYKEMRDLLHSALEIVHEVRDFQPAA